MKAYSIIKFIPCLHNYIFQAYPHPNPTFQLPYLNTCRNIWIELLLGLQKSKSLTAAATSGLRGHQSLYYNLGRSQGTPSIDRFQVRILDLSKQLLRLREFLIELEIVDDSFEAGETKLCGHQVIVERAFYGRETPHFHIFQHLIVLLYLVFISKPFQGLCQVFPTIQLMDLYEFI